MPHVQVREFNFAVVRHGDVGVPVFTAASSLADVTQRNIARLAALGGLAPPPPPPPPASTESAAGAGASGEVQGRGARGRQSRQRTPKK